VQRRITAAPLDGITIVEFATIIAAPLSTSMLADLGALVVKVEAIDGDPYRHLIAGGTVAAKTTAGKSSICVDLKKDEGRRIARDLARTADVVVLNTRPGVAERLGLGNEELRAENPRLVWVSLTGYGPQTPSARRPATHPCAGAAAGGATFQAGAAVTAPCDSLADVREMSRQLMRANEANPDPNSSVVAAAAVVMALLARERFRVGQAVYVNMLAANMYANADDALAYDGKPARPEFDDEITGCAAGYRLYRASDGWVFLAVTGEAEWRRCWDVIERPDLAYDHRFATAAARPPTTPPSPPSSPASWDSDRRATGRIASSPPASRVCGPTHPRPVRSSLTIRRCSPTISPECSHTRFGKHRRWGR
jgi:crotonobetainyl-CoA:carnitine CoA-transferase CaiB-like acyl-CoA transferase